MILVEQKKVKGQEIHRIFTHRTHALDLSNLASRSIPTSIASSLARLKAARTNGLVDSGAAAAANEEPGIRSTLASTARLLTSAGTVERPHALAVGVPACRAPRLEHCRDHCLREARAV